MTTFETMYQEVITGKLEMYDRMIFKGHLSSFFPRGAFQAFLSVQDVLLKDFKPYVQEATAEIKAHAQAIAQRTGRPFIYLEDARTAASGHPKEELAREIAERDGITQGLICVLSALETCTSFDVRGNHKTQKLEVVRRRRKCLHYYFYFIDREFGFMHVRVQSWFPFQVQVYINGREWLCRQLDRKGIRYRRHDNALLWVEDLPRAQKLCQWFRHRRWDRVLDAFARTVNPFLPVIRRLNFGGYYWVADQCELATDVMFKDRQSLEAILPDLFEHAALYFSSDDVLRFLGRKPHPSFLGEVTTDLKRRPEGRRVKHRMKRNSIKMYDKGSVLRIETTINNPREFRILRVVKTRWGRSRRWLPMGKGVCNLWRYARVASQANDRYLEALAQVHPKGKAVAELDRLCRRRSIGGKTYAKFHPISMADCALFTAALLGGHLLNGFRNRDLAALLPGPRPATAKDTRRRCTRVSRVIRKLRGHQLVSKVPGARLYRVTPNGHRLMAAAIRVRRRDFPAALLQTA